MRGSWTSRKEPPGPDPRGRGAPEGAGWPQRPSWSPIAKWGQDPAGGAGGARGDGHLRLRGAHGRPSRGVAGGGGGRSVGSGAWGELLSWARACPGGEAESATTKRLMRPRGWAGGAQLPLPLSIVPSDKRLCSVSSSRCSHRIQGLRMTPPGAREDTFPNKIRAGCVCPDLARGWEPGPQVPPRAFAGVAVSRDGGVGGPCTLGLGGGEETPHAPARGCLDRRKRPVTSL